MYNLSLGQTNNVRLYFRWAQGDSLFAPLLVLSHSRTLKLDGFAVFAATVA